MSDESDVGLMLRVQGGDLDAFEVLVDRYKQRVVGLAGRIVGDLDEAEDLAQGVFVQVFRAAGRYRARAKFSTWLFTIVRNVCLNELRRRGRRGAVSLEGAGGLEGGGLRVVGGVGGGGGGSASDVVLRDELVAKVDEALLGLPVSQRTALLLLREGGVSYEDIGRVLGCSVGAVKSLVHRGRESIRGRLKGYLASGVWEGVSGRGRGGGKGGGG